MRILHTADWQIGMKAAHAGDAGERVREERLAAGDRVVAAANEHGAEVLVVAGDLFEDNAVGRTLVQRTGDCLARFRGPVYLLPGNHDPLVPGSVWEHPVWGSHENLHVLDREEPVAVPGGTLHPCPVREKHSRADPTRAIPDRGDGVRIGVAHGTVEGVPVDVPDFPIARDAAERAGLDYLALGHWHSTALYEDRTGVVRTAYSGTHETTRFGERDSGNALLVTLDAPGTAPVVRTLATGGLAWVGREEEVREAADLRRLREEIEAIASPENTLVRVRLSGVLPAAALGEVERIRELAASRFLFAEVMDSGLGPSPDDAAWVDALPAGLVRAAAERLRGLALRTEDPAGARIAARALVELYAMAREEAG